MRASTRSSAASACCSTRARRSSATRRCRRPAGEAAGCRVLTREARCARLPDERNGTRALPVRRAGRDRGLVGHRRPRDGRALAQCAAPSRSRRTRRFPAKCRWRRVAASHRCARRRRTWARPAPVRYALDVRGDGKRYKLALRTDDAFDGISYQAPFVAPAGAFTTIRLPLSAFVATLPGPRVRVRAAARSRAGAAGRARHRGRPGGALRARAPRDSRRVTAGHCRGGYGGSKRERHGGWRHAPAAEILSKLRRRVIH